MAIAFEWAATAMTISGEMVLPGLLGYLLDQYLGTRVLFLLIGFALGGVLAALSLMRIAKSGVKSPGSAGSGGHSRAGQLDKSGADASSHDKWSKPDAEG
jgi:F0F1-type ATP synthase assembly protein I